MPCPDRPYLPPRPSTMGRSASGRPRSASRWSLTPALPICGSRLSTASCWTSPAVSQPVPRLSLVARGRPRAGPSPCLPWTREGSGPGEGHAALHPSPACAVPAGARAQLSSLSPPPPVLRRSGGQAQTSGGPVLAPCGQLAAPTSRPHQTGFPPWGLHPCLHLGWDRGSQGWSELGGWLVDGLQQAAGVPSGSGRGPAGSLTGSRPVQGPTTSTTVASPART